MKNSHVFPHTLKKIRQQKTRPFKISVIKFLKHIQADVTTTWKCTIVQQISWNYIFVPAELHGDSKEQLSTCSHVEVSERETADFDLSARFVGKKC